MRKPFVWAAALGLAATGLFLASCDDSKGSAPTASESTTTNNTTNPSTGSTATDYNLAITVPSSGDTTVPFAVKKFNITGTITPATGTTVQINGTTVPLNKGAFTYAASLNPGYNKFSVKVPGDTLENRELTIVRRLDAPVLTPEGYLADQREFPDFVVIKFATTNGDSIRYSTNGASSRISSSDPKVASGSTKQLNGTTTIKAIAFQNTPDGVVESDSVMIEFIIGKRVAKPYFSTPRQDSSKVAKKVAILGFGVEDTVRYSIDGGDPDRTSRIYKDSILVSDSMTIIAKSYRGQTNIASPTCTTTVRMIAADPVFSLKSGNYTSQRYLSLKSASGIPVYYTTDGTNPTDQSFQYADSLLIDSNVTIKAAAIRQGWRTSKVISASYTFKVATPEFGFRSGSFDTTQLLKITDSASGVGIHYTMDKSDPTCTSTLYNRDSSVVLDSNVTVKAIACKTGWASSDIVTGNYNFKVAKIVFSPDSGIYRDWQTVKLSTRSPGVTFYVTRDSSTPAWDASGAPTGTTQKILAGDTLSVNKSQWIRVATARNGWTSSAPDSRRYIIEGDTLLVEDFEQNSLARKVGFDWRFWACGYCVSTGIPNQMEAIVTNKTTGGWTPQIADRHGKISFKIPDLGAEEISDGMPGPGYAGYSVGVPSSLMGETYRMVFWARWTKGNASLPDSLPMVTEMTWKKNDNQNGYYHDGFHRYIEWVGPEWRRFVLDFSAFYAAGNAYQATNSLDSTDGTPKSYWILNGFPDSAKMVNMGLSKFQGQVSHSGAWKPRWIWDADHDHWSKNDITNFRWSILQPNTSKAGLAALGHYDQSRAIRGTDTLVCNDCHQPREPWYSDALRATLLKNLEGSLELDRIQLVRRPQISGGTNPVVSTKDTTTTK